MFIGRLGILLFFVLICQANLFHYNYRMNADIASEALLGQVIWNSKQWVPDMWYPSTEVTLIGTANLSALFYGLCGSLKLAMELACVVCLPVITRFTQLYYFLPWACMAEACGGKNVRPGWGFPEI